MSLRSHAAAIFDNVGIDTRRFGKPATYHFGNGDPDKPINVVHIEATEATEDLDDNTGSESELRTADIYLSKDATLGITAPTRDDKITIDGTKWSIEGTPIDKGAHWKLSVRYSELLNHTASKISADRI